MSFFGDFSRPEAGVASTCLRFFYIERPESRLVFICLLYIGYIRAIFIEIGEVEQGSKIRGESDG